MGLPDNLQSGDTITWRDDSWVEPVSGIVCDSGSYTLSTTIASAVGTPIIVAGVPSGTGWVSTLAAAQNSLTPGLAWYQSVLTGNGNRFTLSKGQIQVLSDVTAQTGAYDGRTTAEKALADAEAALANLTASGQKVGQYTIGSRSAKYYTPAELVQAIGYWKVRVFNEGRAQSIRNGLGDPANLTVRFSPR
jgi:hypothetical protein